MPKIKRPTAVLDDEPLVHGYKDADQPAARALLDGVLAGEEGQDRPYCTCRSSGGYRFDQQLGIYVHVSHKKNVFCYKPSKLYYQAAVAAGILVEGQ